MVRISTYSIDPTLSPEDKLHGSDENEVTRNFNLGPGGGTTTINNTIVNYITECDTRALAFLYHNDGFDSNATPQPGAMSNESSSAATFAFSALTTVLVSKFPYAQHIASATNNHCIDIMGEFVGEKVKISDIYNPNNYGIYEVTGWGVDATYSDFYNLNLTHVASNGNLVASPDPLIYIIQIWNSDGGGGDFTSFTASDGTFIDFNPTTTQTGVLTLTGDLSATGEPNASNFLCGNNTWATPHNTGEANEFSFKTIAVGDTEPVIADTTTDTLTFIPEGGMTITTNATNDSVTFSSTDTNTWRPVTVDTTGTGTSNTLGSAETLILKQGTNITLTETGGVVTINSTATGEITGSGTINQIPKFTSSTAIGDSMIAESGNYIILDNGGAYPYLHFSNSGVNQLEILGGSTYSQFTPGAGVWGYLFKTNLGGNALTIRNSNSFIGINVPGTPASQLHVIGTSSASSTAIATIESLGTHSNLHFFNSVSGDNSELEGMYIGMHSLNGNIINREAGNLNLGCSNTVGITIDSANNVGINTTSPDEKLHVVGSIKMVDGNQGVGKVLTSDANGVGAWAAASGGGNSWRPVKVPSGDSLGNSETLELIGGTNITITESAGAVTFTNDCSCEQREIIINGDETLGNEESLDIRGGTNVTITEVDGVVTINSPDTWRTVIAGGNTLSTSETLTLIGGIGIDISEAAGSVTITTDLSELHTSTNTNDSGKIVCVNDEGDSKNVTRANIALSGFNNDLIIDEDNMVTDSSTRSPSQKSVKAFVEGKKVHDLTAPTASFAMNAQKITGVSDPVDNQDAATKNYVDAHVGQYVVLRCSAFYVNDNPIVQNNLYFGSSTGNQPMNWNDPTAVGGVIGNTDSFTIAGDDENWGILLPFNISKVDVQCSMRPQLGTGDDFTVAIYTGIRSTDSDADLTLTKVAHNSVTLSGTGNRYTQNDVSVTANYNAGTMIYVGVGSEDDTDMKNGRGYMNITVTRR